jgi:hypothetical protein
MAPAQPSPAPATQPQGPAQPQAQAQTQTQAATGQPQNGFRDEHCGPPERLWLAGGPILAWIEHGPLPLLATSSTGQTLGGNKIDYGMFNGLEVDGGAWLDCRHVWGVSLGGFLLEQRSRFDSLASDAAGSPTIVRPITDALTVTPTNVLVAFPGALSGSVAYSTSSRLWGAEAGIVHNLFYCRDYSVDIGFGFRYLDLEENLIVDQASQALPGGSLTLGGSSVASVFLEDRFNTRNQFYGGQMTTRGEYRFGPAFVEVISKIALGPNHEAVGIDGFTRSGGITLPGGLLAVGPPGTGGNIGRDVTNRFTVVPEVGAHIGCRLTDHIRVSAGYHFIYMNDVVRPGSQIDTAVNPRLVPISGTFGLLSGPNTPRVTGQHDEFYAHGILFRMEVSY